MKPKRLTWTQWKQPFLDKAKKLDVKLSNKNLARLHSCYISYCWNYGGMSAAFSGAYEEHIEQLICQKPILLNLVNSIPKDTNWNTGVILSLDKYSK